MNQSAAAGKGRHLPRDGALVFVYPSGKLLALYVAFRSLTFDTRRH